MGFLRRLLWLLLVICLLAASIYVVARYHIVDRLTGVFFATSQWLPVTFSLDQFLAVVAGVSFLTAVLALMGCSAILTKYAAREHQILMQEAAGKRETSHIKEERQLQCEQLLLLSQTLTKRLDKRVLVQAIVETASRMTSVRQADSVVSFWLLSLETDTIRFEQGFYCDETLFVQQEFRQGEAPFARAITTQQPWLASSWSEATRFVNPERSSRLGSTTSLMVIPMVVESAVLGLLAVFCHPDALKSYRAQKAFYEAMWGELALGLAIAVQGEVTILDRLTGVHNRDYFLKRLVQEIERANRFQLPLSLLMIDIDNFKPVNDTLGHPQGDAVLKIIGKLIKKEVRAIDLVGRYGGEEFIVMLPETGYGKEATSSVGALAAAERIRKVVDDEFRGLRPPLDLTVSIGLAVRLFPEDREADYRDLVRLADEQLYRAKTTGKNRVCSMLSEPPKAVS